MIIGMMKQNRHVIYQVLAFSALALFIMSNSFASDIKLNSILIDFSKIKQSSASFVEEKSSIFLDEKIIIKGTLFYTAPDTLIKKTSYPESALYKISGDNLIFEKQSEREQLSLSNYPIVEMFVESYRGLLSGNIITLEKYYDVEFQAFKKTALGKAASWLITLIPNNDESLEVIEKIIIKGRTTNIIEVITYETGGDKSSIKLKSISTSYK